MTDSSECMQTVALRLNGDQIAIIRQAHEIVDQTDDQIATGVVVSYIERSLAKPHLSIHSWAYVPQTDQDNDLTLKITMTEGQWRRLDKIADSKRMTRLMLIYWIIADTAVDVGYPRG